LSVQGAPPPDRQTAKRMLKKQTTPVCGAEGPRKLRSKPIRCALPPGHDRKNMGKPALPTFVLQLKEARAEWRRRHASPRS
jgi:hypothetical protein